MNNSTGEVVQNNISSVTPIEGQTGTISTSSAPIGEQLPNLPNRSLEEMQPQELIEEIKKWQRISEERKLDEVTKNKLLSRNVELETSLKDLEDFKKGAKSNFWEAYKTYQSKFNLPDYKFMQKELQTGGTMESQLETYQNTSLVPEIMERFRLDEFEYNPSEAWRPGTPSYFFRTRTEQYEGGLRNKVFEEESRTNQQLKTFTEQRDKDIEYIKNTYYVGKDEDFKSIMNEFNSPESIEKFTNIDNHLLSFKNLFRGYYFDTLTKGIVDAEIQKIHEQYNQLGMKLPKSELPTDITKVPGDKPPISVQKSPFSPMQRNLNRGIN